MSNFDLTHSITREIKNNLALSIPLIASQLVYACSGFISTAFVAHLGKDALAASVLVSMIWMSLSMLFFGILNSVGVLVSHQYGAKNNSAISEIMGQAYLLGIIMCVFIVFVLLMLPLFLPLSSQPLAVLQLAKQYTHSLLWTIPGLVVLVVSEQFLAGIGHSKLVLRISLLVVPIEIPLIYVLVFGKLGLPVCGVAGVGYGFAVTYTLTAISLVFYLYRSKRYQKFQIFSGIRKINFFYLKELIRVGLPMGFMHVIEVSTFGVMTFFVSQFGTSILAAHQIMMQFLGFIITVVFAMSQAVTVRVGHAVGRQDLSEIKYAIYVGMLLNFCCMLPLAIILSAFPHFFLRLDMNIHDAMNATLIHQASLLFDIGSILILFDNFRIIGFGALRGLKDTQFPMYASLVSFWVIGLSAASLLGFYFNFQAEGIWCGVTFGIVCGAVIVFLRIRWLLAQVNLTKILGTSAISMEG